MKEGLYGPLFFCINFFKKKCKNIWWYYNNVLYLHYKYEKHNYEKHYEYTLQNLWFKFI